MNDSLLMIQTVQNSIAPAKPDMGQDLRSLVVDDCLETGEQSCSSCESTEAGWASNLKYRRAWFASLGLLVLSSFATCGYFWLKRNIAGSQSTDPSTLTTVKVQGKAVNARQFWAGGDLMSAVAKRSIEVNPLCREDSSLQICNEATLGPLLVKHAIEYHVKTPRLLLEKLDTMELSPESQQAVQSGIVNIADPLVHVVAGHLSGAMRDVHDSTPDMVVRQLNEKLSPKAAHMDALRRKLFPAVSELPSSDTGAILQSTLRSNGVGFQQRAPDGTWKQSLKVSLPGKQNITRALASIPGPRALSSALFAPGVAPLEAGAPVSGPPPADDFAGDIVAAIGLPLSHLIMCALHHEGKVTLPFWTKIAITVEDALTLGGWGTLGPIGLIIDMMFCWTKRGYHYGHPAAYAAELGQQDFVTPWGQQGVVATR